MSFIANLAHRARQSHSVRYGMMGALAFGSGDYLPHDRETLKQSMRLMGAGSWGVNAVKNLGRTIQRSIDPRIEEMLPQELMEAGEAFSGNRPSPFIANPKIVTPEDWKSLSLLVEKKLLTQEELTSFMNVIGGCYKNHAKLCMDYMRSPTAQNRMRIAEEHLELAPPIFGAVMQVFGRKPEIRERAERGVLTLADVKAAFPNVSKITGPVQLLDDITDLPHDFTAEAQTGRVCTNYVLGKAALAGGVTQGDTGQFIALEFDKVRELQARNKVIHIRDLPESFIEAVRQTGIEFRQMTSECNSVARKMLNASWDHCIKNGLVPSETERTLAAKAISQLRR